MDIKFILLALLLINPIIGSAETKALTINEESTVSKPYFSNALTSQQRKELITTIKIAMGILNDNNLLEKQKTLKFFDSFKYIYPKNGPIDRAYLTKNLFLKLTLKKKNEDKVIWNSGYISFDYKRFNVNELTTLFTPKDFTQVLDLVFEKKNKEVIKYNGKEIASFYLYTYHWKLKPKLKVMFRVQNNFFIEKDDYPRNFFAVELELD